MGITKPTINEIDARLRDSAADLVAHLSGKQLSQQHSGKSESRFGTNGGIAVMIAGPNKGRITLFDGDSKGRSPFQYIQHELGLPFTDAINWASSWLGLGGNTDFKPDPQLEERRRREKEIAEAEAAIDVKKRQTKAQSFVNESIDAAGTPVENYLANRAIESWPDDIRCHPDSENGYDALIALVRDGADNVSAVQRVFLTPDGKKAPLSLKKRSDGVLKKAAVKMPGRGSRLYLAEGPETALSVWSATGAPTWAVLGQNFQGREIPDGMTEIVIAADDAPRDKPAFEQSIKAAKHYAGRGYKVFLVRPDGPNGYDFNDVHQEQGIDALREMLESAPRWIGATPLYKPPTGTPDEAREGTVAFINNWADATTVYWRMEAKRDEAA